MPINNAEQALFLKLIYDFIFIMSRKKKYFYLYIKLETQEYVFFFKSLALISEKEKENCVLQRNGIGTFYHEKDLPFLRYMKQ